METRIIMHDLRLLGVGRRYLGYNTVIKVVRMVVLDENRLLCIKHGILLPLSKELGCDWRAIERNIRTVIHRAWCINREYMAELAGYPIQHEPTVSEFVEMLAFHAQRRLPG